jgi:N-acetylated-alpha-linked acidic dipeptidase
MPVMAGDPLTPGVGATRDAKRLTVKEATTLTKIPVLPLSYADALPLLKALEGPVAPDGWRGTLPITYHLGPGPATVHLKTEFNWKLATAHDVIATLKGNQWPDEWVIRGNHHDAWNFGAADPVSGLVALMEEARALSELVKTGWHPRRTIIYAAWDGEEQGLLGSSEWVETHASTLGRTAVAYVNSDSNGRGFLSMAGSHSLETFANEVSRDVIDPEKKIPVFERLRASLLVEGTAEACKEIRQRRDLRIEALGSGSDYTPFLQHLGVASLNLSYGGEGGGGSYHSIYDSFDHYTRFEDSSFVYGIALAQTAGRMVLRLANAEILPFGFESAADTLNQYLKEIVKLADTLREQTEEKNRQLEEGSLQAFFDPTEPYVLPKPSPAVPYLNFAPIQNALSKVSDSSGKWTRALQEQIRSGHNLPAERLRALNRILIDSERMLIQDAGLPRRPWFRHQIYAPGFYTGYSVKTLPGVREAIEEKNWPEMEAQSQVLVKTLESFAAQIQRATELLKETK